MKYIAEKSSDEIIRLAYSQEVDDRIRAAREGGKDILSVLINDDNWLVREEIAFRGYGLEKLVDDPNENVRVRVANNGYGLHKLVNDEHWFVRAAVAEQGYGLEVLLNDTAGDVAACAQKYISEHPEIKLVYPEPTTSSAELWEKAKSRNYDYRIEAARKGGTDILSKLVFDEADTYSQFVREAVAERGFGLDILLEDTSPEVRRAVVKQGFRLDVLVNDEHYFVKSTVAEQGYGLDKLINEPMGDTAAVAKNYIETHPEDAWKNIAREEIAFLTNNTMIGVVVADEFEEMIPSNMITEAYEQYCKDPMKEQIVFEDFLLAKVEPYFEEDKRAFEEYLVGRIEEKLAATDTGLVDFFHNQIDNKPPIEVLKECGYKKTTIDLCSFVDKSYRLSVMFSEDLDSLITQQGHSVDKIDNPISNNSFIQSVQRNLADIGAGIGKNTAKVAALVSIKGKELLSTLNSLAHKVGDIVLSADTTIGLYNDKGKGSSFSISLDKNAVLPSSSLSELQIEHESDEPELSEQQRKSSVTCALNIDLWSKGRLEITQTFHHKHKDRQPRDIERD